MRETCPECGLPLNAEGVCENSACLASRVGAGSARGGSTGTAPASRAGSGSAQDSGGSSREDFDAAITKLRDEVPKLKQAGVETEIITFCGFPTAGKSWLSFRLMEEFSDLSLGYKVGKDRDTPEPSEAQRMAGIVEIGGTKQMLVHSLTPRDGSGRTILLIDIPGEFLTSLVEGNNDAEIPLALVAALALSDRLILTLPSDVCVIGPLLHCEHRDAGSADERLARANAILAQKTDKMWDERAALASRIKAMREAGQEGSEEYARVFGEFREISINLSEKLIREQWVKLDVFRERVSNALGRAAHVVHKHGRNAFLDKPANTWLDGYSQAAAERLPPIHGGSLAVLTKADRVLPLLTDRDFKVKPGRDWPHLPERQANRDALQASGWRSALARHIGDPRLVLAMTLPKLVSQLDGWLPNMRYEWASAEWQASGWSVNMDLSHDHKGVRELAHWIARGGPDRTIAPAVMARIEAMRAKLEGRRSAGGKSR